MEMIEKLSGWKEKIFETGRRKWLVLLLLGMLLFVIAIPSSSADSTTETAEDYTIWNMQEEQVKNTELESKLETLLRCVEGVGEVRVMIMTGEEKSDSLYSVSPEKVIGVLIAAQGADNYAVVKNIQEAVKALFQVDAHKIKVMKMK